jgi:hypothetical protein
MRLRPFAAAAAVLSGVLLAVPPTASAIVIADYQDDFVVTSDPNARNGWSYFWNANPPAGRPTPPFFFHSPGTYAPLVAVGDQYEAPGTRIVAGSAPVGALDPAFPPDPIFGPYPNTFVRPGPGIADNGSGGWERAIIVGYTFSAEDIAAAGGGQAFITAYDFAVAANSLDGISARIFHDDDTTPLINFSLDSEPPFPFPPAFRFETRIDPRPIPLGTYAAGETVYVVIGSNTNQTLDELRMDFTISLVPEPGTMSLLVPAAGALLMRRRRK